MLTALLLLFLNQVYNVALFLKNESSNKTNCVEQCKKLKCFTHKRNYLYHDEISLEGGWKLEEVVDG